MLSQLGSLSWGFDPRGCKDTDVVRDISQQWQWRSVSYPTVTVCACVHRHASRGWPQRHCLTPLPCHHLGHVTALAPLGLAPFLSWWCCIQDPYFLPFWKSTIIFVYLQTSILPSLEKTSNGCMIVYVSFLGVLGWNSPRPRKMNSFEVTFFQSLPLSCTSFLIQSFD